jgi:2-polyprenyl-6-methoxyphenol hydroxylase-like FAD-dependent oxidoreductase
VLQPSTVHLLDELGLLAYILEQPHATLREGSIRVFGETAGAFSFDRIAPEYPYAIWMPQPIFLSALAAKAAPFPTFQRWMGARVTELIEEGGAVVGVRGLRHGAEPFELRADVVVGADGRESLVRRLGGFAVAYEHYDFDVLWFVIDQPPGWPNTIHISFGRELRGLLLPKYPAQIQAGLILPRNEWRRWRHEGVAAVADRVRRFDAIFTPFADGLRDFTPFFPLQARILLVREWARDGLLLIGDAAHTMSPAGAIGVNVALATAAVAAQEIYPRLGRGPLAKADLARVQALREADVRTLHRLQLGAQRVLLSPAGGSRLFAWLVPRLLPLLVRSPLLPRLQRRLFFGAPLPPLDREFSFR